MAIDIQTLAATIRERGDYAKMSLDPMAQFGTEAKPLLGPTLLPEMGKDIRPEEGYTESQIRYYTTLANAGTSYSPAQMSTGGRIYGSFKVFFGNTNIADQMPGPEYEALLKLLRLSGDNPTMEGIRRLLMFAETSVNLPLLMLNEVYRWMAICDGVVKRRGSNGYSEDVNYPRPAGHRVTVPGGTVAAPAGWYSTTDSYNPFNDIEAGRKLLGDKGYTVTRIISDNTAFSAYVNNPRVRRDVGGGSLTVQVGGNAIDRVQGTTTRKAVNAWLQDQDLPEWEVYNNSYSFLNPSAATVDAQVTPRRFLERTEGSGAKSHCVVLVAASGRNEPLMNLADWQSRPNGGVILPNTLGYYGIGCTAGQAAVGRTFNDKVITEHPYGYKLEGIQEGLPVITEPEAFFILRVVEPFG